MLAALACFKKLYGDGPTFLSFDKTMNIVGINPPNYVSIEAPADVTGKGCVEVSVKEFTSICSKDLTCCITEKGLSFSNKTFKGTLATKEVDVNMFEVAKNLLDNAGGTPVTAQCFNVIKTCVEKTKIKDPFHDTSVTVYINVGDKTVSASTGDNYHIAHIVYKSSGNKRTKLALDTKYFDLIKSFSSPSIDLEQKFSVYDEKGGRIVAPLPQYDMSELGKASSFLKSLDTDHPVASCVIDSDVFKQELKTLISFGNQIEITVGKSFTISTSTDSNSIATKIDAEDIKGTACFKLNCLVIGDILSIASGKFLVQVVLHDENHIFVMQQITSDYKLTFVASTVP